MKGLFKRIAKETRKNGGSSTNMNGDNPSTGYMVSIKDCLIVALDKFNHKMIKKVAKQNKDLLKQNGFIGTWVDNGKVYIDISKNIKSRTQAVNEGIKNNQLGIFDLNTFETIRLKAE